MQRDSEEQAIVVNESNSPRALGLVISDDSECELDDTIHQEDAVFQSAAPFVVVGTSELSKYEAFVRDNRLVLNSNSAPTIRLEDNATHTFEQDNDKGLFFPNLLKNNFMASWKIKGHADELDDLCMLYRQKIIRPPHEENFAVFKKALTKCGLKFAENEDGMISLIPKQESTAACISPGSKPVSLSADPVVNRGCNGRLGPTKCFIEDPNLENVPFQQNTINNLKGNKKLQNLKNVHSLNRFSPNIIIPEVNVVWNDKISSLDFIYETNKNSPKTNDHDNDKDVHKTNYGASTKTCDNKISSSKNSPKTPQHSHNTLQNLPLIAQVLLKRVTMRLESSNRIHQQDTPHYNAAQHIIHKGMSISPRRKQQDNGNIKPSMPSLLSRMRSEVSLNNNKKRPSWRDKDQAKRSPGAAPLTARSLVADVATPSSMKIFSPSEENKKIRKNDLIDSEQSFHICNNNSSSSTSARKPSQTILVPNKKYLDMESVGLNTEIRNIINNLELEDLHNKFLLPEFKRNGEGDLIDNGKTLGGPPPTAPEDVRQVIQRTRDLVNLPASPTALSIRNEKKEKHGTKLREVEGGEVGGKRFFATSSNLAGGVYGRLSCSLKHLLPDSGIKKPNKDDSGNSISQYKTMKSALLNSAWFKSGAFGVKPHQEDLKRLRKQNSKV